MKVLVFTGLYPNNVWPNHGVFIKERMTHFGKLDGCEIKVVAPVPYFPTSVKFNWRWRYSQVTPLEIRDNVEVYHPRYYTIPKVGMSLYGLLMFLSVLGCIRKVQKKFDFDLIDAHFVYPDGFAGVLLGWFFRKPVVVSARGSDINRYSHLPIIRQVLRFTLNKAVRSIAVSMALKQSMIKIGARQDRISVIPNGVSLDKFRPLPKTEARYTLELPPHKRIVLSVGHLTSNKGFDLIITAMQILRDHFHEENLHLVIVGEGIIRRHLERVIDSLHLREVVSLVGAIPHEDLYPWYSAADVFCLASRQEGWPNVILESLACGTPVIATAVGGIPEIICSENVGFLTERDPKKIARAIYVALNKSWQTDYLVEYARSYSWERTALEVRRLFETVLNPENQTWVGHRQYPHDATRNCVLVAGTDVSEISDRGRSC